MESPENNALYSIASMRHVRQSQQLLQTWLQYQYSSRSSVALARITKESS